MDKHAMAATFVPTALHAQLTEYTNLVRVIRTTRTLDLTAHLLAHAAQHDGDEADTWTAWPLIDCTVPEWSIDDEIRHLAETVARAHDGHNDDPLFESPAAANRLVFHTTAVLTHLLALLADLRPAAPGSMQNRLAPMNWEDVISLLAVSGVVHPFVLARAERRIERIYGPSTTKAMVRRTSATSARSASTPSLAEEEGLLFASPALLRALRSDGKGHRNECGVKSSPIDGTDSAMDA